MQREQLAAGDELDVADVVRRLNVEQEPALPQDLRCIDDPGGFFVAGQEPGRPRRNRSGSCRATALSVFVSIVYRQIVAR